jgi:putative transcriptional regulator
MAKPTLVTNRIPELRAAAGISQGNLGDRVGVTRQTVNAIERCRYSPTLEVAFKIARVFGLPVEAVFGYPDGSAPSR